MASGLDEIETFVVDSTLVSIHSPGAEDGVWRQEHLIRSLLRNLPSFTGVFTTAELVQPHEMDEIIEKAAQLVYNSPKYQNRGEFGELILHALLERKLGLQLVLSKIIHKTSLNDTVKGFDTVFIETDVDEPKLWLGESKLYTNFSRAHSDVREELETHLGTEYLRNEFLLIAPKIPEDHPSKAKILEIIESTKSMDELRKRLKVPVLLGYQEVGLDAQGLDSSGISEHALVQKSEYQKIWTKNPIDFFNVDSTVFLLPYPNKKRFIEEFDKRLKMKAGSL